eukprot:12355678-Karenia_brevis.AAC.1
MDDPMHADEIKIRGVEKSIIKDLVGRRASARLVKNAHLLPSRLSNVPESLITRGGFEDNVLKIDHLLSVVR